MNELIQIEITPFEKGKYKCDEIFYPTEDDYGIWFDREGNRIYSFDIPIEEEDERDSVEISHDCFFVSATPLEEVFMQELESVGQGDFLESLSDGLESILKYIIEPRENITQEWIVGKPNRYFGLWHLYCTQDYWGEWDSDISYQGIVDRNNYVETN